MALEPEMFTLWLFAGRVGQPLLQAEISVSAHVTNISVSPQRAS